MQIEEITNKKIWEDFLAGIENKTFLQSWNWGEFQKSLGEKVWRFGIFDKGQLLGVAQVVKVKAKRGNFLLLSHAPLISSNTNKAALLEVLTGQMKELAKKEGCLFIRVASVWQRTKENSKIFQELGFKQAPLHIHPELTWELDLTPSEDEILQNMRKTTRYLIKQGLRDKDLKIEKSANVKDVEIFNNLYQKTVDRHHFVPFSLNYLKNEFLAFSKDNEALIFLAKYKGECIASAIIIFWGGIGFYHQGASSQKYPKVPASYLLQWEAIKEAKQKSCKSFNFWGIADVEKEEELESHPWRGLSLFKQGFGGRARPYLKTQDLPVSWRYWLTCAFEKLRSKKRGF